MDYQTAETGIATIEQQAQTMMQKAQALGDKLKAGAPDETTGREWLMDFKELLLAFQAQHQQMVGMVNEMAAHIQSLEQAMQSHPAPTVASRGWANQPSVGGGFWGNVTSGIGMGAGFAVANDLISGLFNAF